MTDRNLPNSIIIAYHWWCGQPGDRTLWIAKDADTGKAWDYGEKKALIADAKTLGIPYKVIIYHKGKRRGESTVTEQWEPTKHLEQ